MAPTNTVTNVQAKLVLIDIGSNDLCQTDVSPSSLVYAIRQFVTQCLNLGAKIVIVTEIFPRALCSDPDYNNKVHQTNHLLKAAALSRPHFIFWEHYGRNLSSRFLNEFIHTDGVHMNTAGLRHYLRSLRGGVLLAEKALLVCIVQHLIYFYYRLPTITN